MHFVLGNPIVVVNIGRMVAMKIISKIIKDLLKPIFLDLRDDNLLFQ